MNNSSLHTERILSGRAGAPGRAHGAAYRWEAAAAATGEHADPRAALTTAFATAAARLEAAIAKADDTLAPLLEAQRLMLDDPELREGAFALVDAGTAPAAAVTQVAEMLADVLAGAGSEYFRERAIDVRAAGTLVAEELAGGGARQIPPGAVVLARELAPLDTARLGEAGVAALVTVTGGPTCHAAIIARAWGIPAIVGAPEAVLAIADGTPLLVDGATGQLTIAPSAAELAEMAAAADGGATLCCPLPLYANVGSVQEAQRAAALGAEGVGLLRTEFLFQDRAVAPSEDEQTAEYTAILRAMAGRPVVVRTLDIGADKPVPFLPMPAEPNPQLGLRGVRLCLQETALFRTQLRALIRAGATGPLKIMLPMVTHADEIRAARALLEAEAAALGLPVPPLGAMIEVPMAALGAPELAEACDFFSLGTNDLLQFLLAADRQHAGVGYLHEADHPGVWRLLETVVAAAHAAAIPVSVCGEWGSDPAKLPRLTALGVDTVSVSVGALGRMRRA